MKIVASVEYKKWLKQIKEKFLNSQIKASICR